MATIVKTPLDANVLYSNHLRKFCCNWRKTLGGSRNDPRIRCAHLGRPKGDAAFEGASDKLEPDHVIDVPGLPSDDPEIWGVEYEATAEQGQRLLGLMGLAYSGPASFRVSRKGGICKSGNGCDQARLFLSVWELSEQG